MAAPALITVVYRQFFKTLFNVTVSGEVRRTH